MCVCVFVQKKTKNKKNKNIKKEFNEGVFRQAGGKKSKYKLFHELLLQDPNLRKDKNQFIDKCLHEDIHTLCGIYYFGVCWFKLNTHT